MTSTEKSPSPLPASTLWLAAAMWGSAWLVPIHELPWAAFHSDLASATALVLLAVSLLRVTGPRIEVPFTAVAAAMLSVIPALQAASGLILFAGDAWMASLYLLGFAVALACGHIVARRRMGGEAALAYALVAVGCASALMALWQWMQWPPPHRWLLPMLPGYRPAANVGQSNMLATLLVLAMLASLALHQASRLRPWVVVASAAILIPGIAVTQSRTGLLALAAALLWLWTLRRRVGLRLGNASFGALLAWLAVCVLAQPVLAEAWQLQLGRPALDMQVGARRTHWQTLLQAIGQAPWFGYGWNQVAVAQAAVPDQALSGEFIEHSHNLLLDLLIWNGLPLGLLLISALLWWTLHRARLCRSPQVALLLGGVWVLLVHAMTEYPLDYFGYLMLLGLLMGAVDALVLPASRQTLMVPHRAAVALTLLGASLTARVTLEYTSLEADHALMRMQWARPELVTAGPDAVPSVVLLTQVRALLVFMRMPLDSGLSDPQQDFMARVSKRYGYAPVLIRHAIALHRNGRINEAQAVLSRLCKTQPAIACTEARRQFAAASGTPAQ